MVFKGADPGSEGMVNGYITIKQDDGTWKYKHRIIAEEKLGRPLSSNERVYFLDGNRENFSTDNIVVKWMAPTKQYKNRANLRRRVLEARARLKSLEDQLAALDATLEDGPIAKVQEGRGGRSYQRQDAESSEV